MAKKDAQRDSENPAIEDPEYTAVGGIVWKGLSAGATLFAAAAAHTVASKGWRVVTGKPIPTRTDWDRGNGKDIVAYSAISAALLTGAKVAAERTAAEFYRKSTNHLPKAIAEPKLTRAEKKAKKKVDKKLERATKAAERSAERLRS